MRAVHFPVLQAMRGREAGGRGGGSRNIGLHVGAFNWTRALNPKP